jgi:hypothetical protein
MLVPVDSLNKQCRLPRRFLLTLCAQEHGSYYLTVTAHKALLKQSTENFIVDCMPVSAGMRGLQRLVRSTDKSGCYL